MTGYLQRLAASIAAPRSTLHPMVGSVFGGGAPVIPEESPEQVAERSPDSTRLTAAVEGEYVAASAAISEQREERVGQPPLPATQLPAQQTAREAYQPLVPRPAVEVQIPALHREVVRETATAPAPADEPRLQPLGKVFSIPARSKGIETGRRSTFEPWQLGEEAPTSTRGDETPRSSAREVSIQSPSLRLPQNPLAAAGNPQKMAETVSAVPPSSSSAQTAGDVEIHIGRIEVIAVQPAPPRPVVAPANKATNLEDYLKRRNRGAG
jgi:hypothetical protein